MVKFNFNSSLATVIAVVPTVCSMAQEKPMNVIFIMSDDHTSQAIGAYGSHLAKLNPTPNIDELASDGVVFDNCFCTNSISTPSRACIMTGQYSHHNEVLTLDEKLDVDRQYLVKEFSKMGYQTAMVGKWHLKNEPANFDYYKVLNGHGGQGEYFNPTFLTNEISNKEWPKNQVKTNGYSSDVITNITIDWLKNRRDKNKPFFLMHHYKAPHDMFEYAPRYKYYLEDTEVPVPESLYNQDGWGSEATRGKKDAAEVNKKPNVLFIYADDIGYGDLSCYGGKSIITPNVEKLASEGIMFTNAHCGASTSTPSRYGMLTGEYPWRKKGTGIAAGDAAMIIKPNIYTMADMFVDAGYSTGVIGKWHLGLGDKAGQQDWNGLVSPNPSDIGFEFSHIMAATADRVPCIWIENGRALGLSPDDPVEVSYTKNFPGEPTGKDNPELLRLHPSHGHDMSIVNGISRIGYMRGGKSALWRDQDIQDSIIANAVRFIEEKSASDKPWFLYLATNDIHVPRDPHERFVGKSGHGLRGDALLSFDWGVGEVMKTLERLGIDENTIVVLSSDNGPVIDDGYKDQAVELLGDHKPAGDLRGGKYSNYEAGTRVPCILRWKNHVKPGVNDLLMSQLDWFASFAAMTGVTLPDGAAPDSENLLDAWLGKSEKGKEYFVTQNIQNFLGITDGEWKFIPRNNAPALNVQTNTELGNSPKDQLFKLNGDRSESVNVIDKNPEVAAKLKKELERIVDNRYLQNMN